MLKHCKKCDTFLELNIVNFHFVNYSKRWGHICRDCQKIDWKEKWLLKKEKAVALGFESIHKYRLENNKNYGIYEKGRYQKPKSKTYNNNRNKNDIDNLNDRYIKELIVKSKGINVKDISQELIDVYRLNLKLKREIKNAGKS